MKYLVVAVSLFCLCAVVLAGSAWVRWRDGEVSPVEYGALYSLRRMEPELFKEKILPELEKALADKRLTHGELCAIEKKFGSLGERFLTAVKERSFDEQLSESLNEAGKKTKETGRNLGDALGKVLDDAMDYMIRQSEELTKKAPPAPKPADEPPAKF